MLQVLNQADGEDRGGVERSPLSPNPSPQTIPTRPRGIKFPISANYVVLGRLNIAAHRAPGRCPGLCYLQLFRLKARST